MTQSTLAVAVPIGDGAKLSPPTTWTPAPAPTQPAAVAAALVVAPRVVVEPPLLTEVSPWLARTLADDTLASSARRAGLGLALTLPFAVAAGLRAPSLSTAAVASLSLPIGLAMIALVGVAASSLGVSMTSAPLAPTEAVAIASRGLFRVGVLLVGLAPVTALWVAGGRPLEGLLAATLAVGISGAAGIGAIVRGLVVTTSEPDGTWRVGAVVVALLFGLFALVVGLRVWLGALDGLGAPLFGDL